jgi:hypothetical protein
LLSSPQIIARQDRDTHYSTTKPHVFFIQDLYPTTFLCIATSMKFLYLLSSISIKGDVPCIATLIGGRAELRGFKTQRQRQWEENDN